MSEDLLATIITVVILAGLVLWVPLLNVVCARCARFFLTAHPSPRLATSQDPSRSADSALDSNAA